MTEQDFKTITDEEILKQLGYTVSQWRHYFVNGITGFKEDCGGGQIIIKFPDGTVKRSRTKNLNVRLVDILVQLMSPRNIICKDTWIRNLKKTQSPLKIKDIKELNIRVIKDYENYM